MPLGIITRTTLGLIAREDFESYPNGWTFEQSGTTTALAKTLQESTSHSGGGDFLIDTGRIWPASAYARLYKSVAVGSAGNRTVKLFRGPGLVASVMDHFYGTVFDTEKWRSEGGTSPTVANSVLTIPNGNSGVQGHWVDNYVRWRTPVKVKIRAKIPAPQSGQHFNCTIDGVQANSDNRLSIDFGGHSSGRAYANFAKYGDNQWVDIGPVSDFEGAYHIYDFEWTSSVAKIYLDGTLKATADGSHVTVDEDGYNYFPRIWLGIYAGYTMQLDVDYIAHTLNGGLATVSFKIGSQNVFDQDMETEGASLDNTFFEKGWTALTVSGTQTLELKLRNTLGSTTKKMAAQVLFDDMIIMSDSVITIQGLLTGQKVELYDSGGTLKNTVTKNGGNPTIDISSYIKSAGGWLGYFKVYDINGTTLLHTSATTQLWGGDIWLWSSQTSRIWIPAGSYRIYKQGAVATPKTLTVDIYLKWLSDDTPINNKLIAFSTSQGAVSPASATTDSNGKVTVTLTSGASMGWAILKANWAGDGDVSPAKAYLEVAIYDGADAGNSALSYQLFVQGRAYDFTSGVYKKATRFASQSFEVELPQVEATIDGAYEVVIYRRGVKDFVGRIRKITKTIDNRMILNGVSNHWKLGRRVVDSPKSYNLEPKSILEDLLTRFACGVSEGSIGIYGVPVQIPFDYDTITAAFKRLLDATGWQARLNLDDSFDFAVDFGNHTAVEFKTGESNVALEHELDFDPVDTRTILIGDPSTLVSDLDDATAAATQGLVEEVFFDKNVTAKATLDAENANILGLKKQPVERVSGAVIDLGLGVNIYNVFDYVTITDPVTGTAGEYRVVSIERNMTDQGFAILEIGNAQRRLGDLVAALSGKVKDLSA